MTISLQFDTTLLSELSATPNHPVLKTPYAEFCKQHMPKLATVVEQLWQSNETSGAFTRWLTLNNDTQVAQKIEAYAKSIKGQFDAVVILGIGGSSLGPAALCEALLPSYWNELSQEQRNGYPKIYFVDNVDSDKIDALLHCLDFSKTLINVVTKSGNTTETLSAFLLFQKYLEKAVGKAESSKHIVITTDPEKGTLKELATEAGWTCFDILPDVGGRFSIFSPVGLLPAALVGLSPSELLQAITDSIPSFQATTVEQNPAAAAAMAHYYAMEQGLNISVLMPYSAKLTLTADWYVQLWAESLGKAKNLNGETINVGQTPVRAVGVTDQHSQLQLFGEGPYDKLVTFIHVLKNHKDITVPNTYPNHPGLSMFQGRTFNEILRAEAKATHDSLHQEKRPTVSYTLESITPTRFAQLLFCLEMQTALTGALMGIDPFNQPGVELSKVLTKKYLQESLATVI